MHHPTNRIAHTTAFGIPVVDYWFVDYCPYIKWKEGIGLFNDALNTFYLRLYGIRYMVKREETRCHHIFSISSKDPFICTIPQTE